MRSRFPSDRESKPKAYKALKQDNTRKEMDRSQGASQLRISTAQTYVPASSRAPRLRMDKFASADCNGAGSYYDDAHNWTNPGADGSIAPVDLYTPVTSSQGFSSPGSIFSTGKSDITAPSTSAYPDFLYPDSPMFGSDSLAPNTMGGSFPSTFACAEAPLMELSLSSGAVTGCSNDFSASDGSFNGDATSPHFWIDSSPDGDVPFLDVCAAGHSPWTPPIGAADLSFSSASDAAILSSGLMGSPTAFVAEDYPIEYANSEPLLTQFTLDSTGLGKSPYENVDLGRFVDKASGPRFPLDPLNSTVAVGDAYLAGSQMPVAFSPVPYNVPRAKAFYSNRLSSDGENIKARQHEWYSVVAGPDGLFHCPYVLRGECTRRPDKLKCNYDKHLDSHLKPYRCLEPACIEVPFSSTACLLRHEREAHGLHGHGDRPYSCHFDDCERGRPGNGFPRRWNLQDHMRRVHHHVEQELESSSTPDQIRPRRKRGSATGSATGSIARRGSRSVSNRTRS